jgi:hypothetical protein
MAAFPEIGIGVFKRPNVSAMCQECRTGAMFCIDAAPDTLGHKSPFRRSIPKAP